MDENRALITADNHYQNEVTKGINARRSMFPQNLQLIIKSRDSFTCQTCQKTKNELKTLNIKLEVVHIKELWQGGLTVLENGQTKCRTCHDLKIQEYEKHSLVLKNKIKANHRPAIIKVLKTLNFYLSFFKNS
jgi:5-methylcytosine-specific restriction endonuclease McrA